MAPNGAALALAAGQVRRLAFRQFGHAQNGRDCVDGGVRFGLGSRRPGLPMAPPRWWKRQ
jgi:hypothetical protein